MPEVFRLQGNSLSYYFDKNRQQDGVALKEQKFFGYPPFGIQEKFYNYLSPSLHLQLFLLETETLTEQ